MSQRKHRNYQVDEVARALNLKHDVLVSTHNGIIQILIGPTAKNDIGIKSKGKIDFLRNHCGFVKLFVKKFIQ